MRICDWSSDVCSSDLTPFNTTESCCNDCCCNVEKACIRMGYVCYCIVLFNTILIIVMLLHNFYLSTNTELTVSPFNETFVRSEERREGKECVGMGISRLSTYH